jgi:hypothetical protein
MLDEEQGALALAGAIEDAVNNPQKAVQRIEEKMRVEGKTDTKGIFGTIVAFIKDYQEEKKKLPEEDWSNEDWLKQQFAKPEYAKAWEGDDAEKERAAAAVGIVQGVEDYENAKKSLRLHIELGNTRASWLAKQIEIGAANNNKDLKEYAEEVNKGLNEARKENAEFLFDSALNGEAK